MSSRSRNKKQKRKGKKAHAPVHVPVVPPIQEETSKPADGATAVISESDVGDRWTLLAGAEETTQNMYALRVYFLGPFLFGQPTLCEKAMQTATECLLLPADGGLWPMFFEQDKWHRVQIIVKVVTATVNLCQTNQSFREYTMDSKTGALQDDSSLAELVQLHSDGLTGCPLNEVEVVFKIVRIHVAHFTVTASSCRPGHVFMQSLADKEQLVAPVKERGNVNYKKLRYRASIADYTRAIKLCPYSPVLYCNRALCYLKNGDFWYACVDSYRALVLKPEWEKPYYRCAEAWIKLGDINNALTVNVSGRTACSERADLDKQYKEIQTLITAARKPSVGLHVHGESTKEKEKKKKYPPDTGQQLAQKETERSRTKDLLDKKEVIGKGKGEGKRGGVSSKQGTHHSSKKEDRKEDRNKPPIEPFTNFEALRCPPLGEQISIEQLKCYCQEVKLETLTPSIYTGHSEAWDHLEPAWTPPPKPTIDRASVHEPMTAHFDEIWCPILADVRGSEDIVPPTFHYLPSDACVRQSYTPPYGTY